MSKGNEKHLVGQSIFKQIIKLIPTDVHADMPQFVKISEAKMHDKNFLQYLNLSQGSMIVFDKAYNYYLQFVQWTQMGVNFVCRLKENAYKKPCLKRNRKKGTMGSTKWNIFISGTRKRLKRKLREQQDERSPNRQRPLSYAWFGLKMKKAENTSSLPIIVK